MTDAPAFSDTFTITSDNPLLNGHVVYGRSLMPGVGYVDLVLQVLARHGHAVADVELRNLAILAPLVAAPGEHVEATISGLPAPAGGWRIEIRSRLRGEDAHVLHATVSAHRRTAPDLVGRLPLPIDGGPRHTPLADIYAWCREHGLVHSGLMKVLGGVHHRSEDWVVELELAAEYHHTAAGFLFHPALFEAGLLGGGVGINLLHSGDDGTGLLFLPLVFESFRAVGSLGKRCFVRVPAGSVARDGELIRMAVEFYDETGVQVAEIGQFVAKQVRATDHLDVRGDAAQDGTAPARRTTSVAVVAEPAPGGWGVVEVLRGLVAERLGGSADDVDVEGGFYELGLASADLLSLVVGLEDRLAVSLSPTVMFEYGSITELAGWLEDHLTRERGAAGPAGIAPVVPDVPAPPPDDVRDAVAAEVTAAVASVVKVPVTQLDPGVELADFGVDLPMLADLADLLNDRYGLALTAGFFDGCRTITSIVDHVAGGPGAPLHPLLRHDLTDGDTVTFQTRLEGSEPYLRDHQVRGTGVLPGVVHLEVARAAAARVLGTDHVRLGDVVWLRPATCGSDGLTLRVAVRTTPVGAEFTVSTVEDGEAQVCSQGTAAVADDHQPVPRRLEELRALCTEVFPADHVYARYADLGIDYGPTQRSLVEVRVGAGVALAELRLPAAAGRPDLWLDPSILDGALQATIGLKLSGADGRQERLGLPFTVRRVNTTAALPARAYAWIRQRADAFDVTVLDEHGTVCAELTGLSSRPLADAPRHTVVPRRLDAGTDIAIVGVSGRYPQAADLTEFWQNLREGRDSITEVPPGRWDPQEVPGTSKWGGFLDGIDLFDPLFFQISLLEAEGLDPQERLFLQTAHHVLEDAGYTGEELGRAGKVGVFVGVMYQEYQLFGAQAQERGRNVALWGSASTIANRVSYFYDFRGPSIAVDTMCSSSLTAIHLACEAIRSGQCVAAIAGGVNLSTHPNKYMVLSRRHFLSSDGRCRSFGAGGDGYVPGEGVGAVLLKPLARAVADGDHVHGVIKATAVNHGGRTTGYSVPTPVAQGEVIADALTAAGVEPRSLSYLEAHGTGTSLGDPIEIAGLTKAFRQVGGAPARVAIGSVKSNIGHAESAAGIAGVTKVLLQLRHGELVPSLHASDLNPHIDFDSTPLRVQRHLEPWRRPTVDVDGEARTFPRIAGVSSFGGGGSNAHVVIAEYEPDAPVSRTAEPAVFVLSAKSEPQLDEMAERLHSRLAELTDDDLPDVAWTLQSGRMALEERLAFVAMSVADARAQLRSFVARHPDRWIRGSVRPGGPPDAAVSMSDSDVARRWAEGAPVRWQPPPSARRVGLPGYPFARERYWFDPDADATAVPQGDLLLLRPVWNEEPVPAGAPAEYAERHIVVIGRLAADERAALRSAVPAGSRCEFVEPADGTVDDEYLALTQRVFTVIRRILERGVREPVLLQVVAVGTPGDRSTCYAGLGGLLKTAQLENPLLRTQYVASLDGAAPTVIASRLASEVDGDVRHVGGRRYVGRLTEVAAQDVATPWRPDGVYLITGGAGALGLVLAREIASTGPATIVLTGRSELTPARQAELDAVRATGSTVDYQRVDVADRASVARLLTHIADNHGPLTGVLHGAGVIDDALILRKDVGDLAGVLAPKVAGLVNLDELTQDQPLDMFVCFSSIAGAFGNPGQADYAAANAFMDAYAAYRTETGHRTIVSVNWPFWDEGGMGDHTVRQSLRDAAMVPLDTGRGLAALRQAVTAGERMVVVAGERDVLLSRITPPGPSERTAPSPQRDALEDRAVGHLRRQIAAALRMGTERLDPDVPLERYGMDSVLAVNLIGALEESFGPLSRTLLFEADTIRALARHFAVNHPRKLSDLLGEPVVTRPRRPEPTTAARPEPVASRRPGHGDEVAVVGIAGRYPQADDLDTFWANLRAGRDSVTEVPADRWDQGSRREWGAFLDHVDRFDPLLFGISPREAAVMDPQQRLFLQTVWHLLEQSGVTQEVIERRYGRRVGVYVGTAYQMYRADASDPVLAALTATASYNLIANRVSHFFGLEGPSLAVDSMCTSSAMAIHLACVDLARGESDLSIAGGVNLTIHPDKYVALSEMKLLGTHRGSRSFRAGDGYLPAEAVGAVLLKRLDAAIEDGDTIHAVIRSTASMHGGRANGFMTPSHRTQVSVMRRALERAGCGPETIGYVEAAANGTAITDEVEIRALREVFAGLPEPVTVGTVKSNLGHPEAASGIAQLTKVVLQLRHQELAPLVAVGDPNPNLDLEGAPLRLAEQVTAWPLGDGTARRALINSVAAGGSHVSMVVEAPPEPAAVHRPRPGGRQQVVVLSARTEARLREAVRRLHDFLDEGMDLVDIAYTSQLGREPLAERLAVVAGSVSELRQALAAHLAGAPAPPAAPVWTGNSEDDTGPLGTVLSGVRGEAFLAALAQDGDLENLAELWVRGIRVPWQELHDGPRPLTPLPATAFETGSYWLGRTPVVTDADASRPVPAPRATDARQTIIAAWSEVLQVDESQLDDRSDFFAFGGNSLMAGRLINLVAQWTGVELPVQTVFDAPRIGEMAAELQRRAPAAGAVPDLTTIAESLALIETMSDAELDALGSDLGSDLNSEITQ